MLNPHPVFLRQLVDDYLAALRNEDSLTAGARDMRLHDLGYTLCVSTGTHDVLAALERARRFLSFEESRAAS
ncbi:DUF5133 domain-containing protein [Streptomyces sp. NPDC058394]|uniref:DUF5133 domain-containing protein n=1 Tax=Streptomyces sp. NPDC058394 TaxID=3346477 RepID=UPI0036663EC4